MHLLQRISPEYMYMCNIELPEAPEQQENGVHRPETMSPRLWEDRHTLQPTWD